MDLTNTFLGIELGSTRIKAVLIDENHAVLASGGFTWENQLVEGYWTYSLEEVWTGLQHCVRELRQAVRERYGTELTTLRAIGISGMMHGYLPFDKDGRQLAAFRTWRNTTTARSARELTELFHFNIPQRWSIAHLYQAILNGEEHVKEISFITTLAGYVHWKLTGEKVVGIGEGSGMFPIDSERLTYRQDLLSAFDELAAQKGFAQKAETVLPRLLRAGDIAGALSEEGARLLDPTGHLCPGIPLCPPEGDAGTGMVATNAVARRSGNVSAGTSVFAMVVLERALAQLHEEIDMVTTPSGAPVAMVHCNNCTNELNAWAQVFHELTAALGQETSLDAVYGAMFRAALEGAPDGGGLLAYNYLSGEPITHVQEGRPLLVRRPEDTWSLANLMRTQLYSAVATLKLGLDILKEEQVIIDTLMGHGGFFKTTQAGQRVMAAAVGAPVCVMETAGEGGPWGMALLAAYSIQGGGMTLEEYLSRQVFEKAALSTVVPEAADVAGFEQFMERYKKGLALQEAAAAL